jgi:2-polyprenyl-6-methoxyphenol hydroxylase-like FAD-dependent oxidoreductase
VAELRFGETVTGLRPGEGAVAVRLGSGAERVFHLVVGADGLHSPTRDAILGASAVRPLGYWTAAFTAPDYPHRDPGAYVSFTQVGRQVARYALRDGSSAFFFFFRAPRGRARPPDDLAEQKALIRAAYGDGWECPEILDRLDSCDEIYMDSVAQVEAPAWSKGRVALVGDAAYCPSLLAGEGASFAMAGAYVLAGELARTPDDPADAFRRYEASLRGFIARKQKAARWMAGWFAPRTAAGLLARNALTRLTAVPAFGKRILAGSLRDDFELPAPP